MIHPAPTAHPTPAIGLRSRRRGFSAVEIAMVATVVTILALILVPVVRQRLEQARISTALADARNIAAGLDAFATEYGSYPRLFLLPFSEEQIIDFDPGAPSFYQNLNQLFISPRSGEFLDPALSAQLLEDLQGVGTNPPRREWFGPFLSFNRDNNLYTGLGDTEPEPDGIPDDPWGNNYLFVTKAGLVIEPSGVISATAAFPGNAPPTTGGGVNTAGTGRFAIISLGPNGVPGTPGDSDILGEGDDIVFVFGP